MTVASVQGKTFIIERTDTPQSASFGLTAVYTGQVSADGKSAGGAVTFTWPNHRGFPATGAWTATWEDAATGTSSAAPPSTTSSRPAQAAGAVLPQAAEVRQRPVLTEGSVQPPRFRALPRQVNLDGLWQIKLIMPDNTARTVTYRIKQQGDNITLEGLLGPSTTSGVIYKGRIIDNSVIDGSSFDNVKGTPQYLQWVPEKQFIDDPDHLRSSVSDGTMARASVHADDIPCDTGNSYRVTPGYAFLRGRSAIREQNDFSKAACWFHAAAIQGDARSQGVLAYMLSEAPGVAHDYAQAFAWAEKSAAQDDFLGEIALGVMYHYGQGTPANPEKAQHWLEIGFAHAPQTNAPQTSQPAPPQWLSPRKAVAIGAVLAFVGTAVTIGLLEHAGIIGDEEAIERWNKQRRDKYCNENPVTLACREYRRQ